MKDLVTFYAMDLLLNGDGQLLDMKEGLEGAFWIVEIFYGVLKGGGERSRWI